VNITFRKAGVKNAHCMVEADREIAQTSFDLITKKIINAQQIAELQA